MRKYFSIAAIAAFILILFTSCSADMIFVDNNMVSNNQTNSINSSYELALITDAGETYDIENDEYIFNAWLGLKNYAEENNITYKSYQPSEASDEAYLAAITSAASAGAKLLICSGDNFDYAVYKAQLLYPELAIIFLDALPESDDNTQDTPMPANVYSILHSEQQIGFLAGYAAVKEGYKNLGFIGAMAVPSVVSYGAGFIMGANYAAKEMQVPVEILYDYSGLFYEDSSVVNMAGSWFINNTEIIFASGGSIGKSVMLAAESADMHVIGVDVDQSKISDSVLFSSVKNITKTVYDTIGLYYSGEFPGGKTVTLDLASGGIGIDMSTSKMINFSEEDYNLIVEKFKSGEIVVESITSPTYDLTTLAGEYLTLNIID